MYFRKIVQGLFIGLVSACGVAIAEVPEATEIMRAMAKFYVSDIEKVKRYSEAELDAVFLGDTVLLSLSRNRYRVVHFDEDGLLSAWFPGRDYVGKADFGIIDNAAFCVDSIARSTNGTGEVTCQSIDELVGNIIERVEGDPFNLAASATPPWSLPAVLGDMSIAGVEALNPKNDE